MMNSMSRDAGYDKQESIFPGLIIFIWQNKILLAVMSLLGALLAIGISYFMDPQYKADTVVMPMDPNTGMGSGQSALGELGGLAGLAGLNLRSGVGQQEALGFLRSREFATQFIQSHGLIPILLSDDDALKDAKATEFRRLARAYLRFKRISSITENLQTGLVTVSIMWPNRQTAANWTNQFVKAANEELRGRAIAEAKKSVEHLQLELEKTQMTGVREGIFRLIEQEIRTATLASARSDYAFRVVDFAAVPDLSERVRPKRAFMAVLGFVMGGLVAVFVAFARNWNLRERIKAASALS